MTGAHTSEPRRVALVSGGSRGIGRAVVVRLAQDGHDIAFCYHSRAEAAAEAAEEATRAGARVLARKVDVSDPAACQDFVTAAEQELGPVDVAVTAAGITRDKPLVQMDDAMWRDVMATNLDGTFHISRAVLQSFIKRRTGCLVALSSVAGVYGSASQTNYAASKAGIIGFTRSVAKEYGRFGVRANVVAPGFVTTDMTAGVGERTREKYLGQIPLRRFGAAEEVADLVAFLASDRAGYINGQVIGIDGGLVI
ncbi:3-oxoacyl-ACP reductase FabG [Streptacidiphilus jiangxiensis]|uniref:3-oxoacyl-[acyl-carrier protein] reductase n=1 Tax=Streptacidiphilus jiangxiensis TaxID=235985 RepID=A0A1H7VNK0_STRJI|nr:3-oxoacyl-ACP reductase FabG [Streptacidiphilus jiangxiensis]SEM10604.1 3-oxoacyl-[acyl-carrier protein] reductase [Streptacidiphilus jiangxiensis]